MSVVTSMLAAMIVGNLQTPTQAYLAKDWTPADPKASRQVRSLIKWMRSLSGKKVISGQTDFPDAQYVEKISGRIPKILALDFLGTPKSAGGEIGNTQVAIDWAKRGGIVAYQWHWVAPGASDKGKGFYTNSTDFDLEKALANPNSSGYKGLVQDIDDVAVELKKLDKEGIPVLFRPLHEAQGRWFWWGAKGAKPCVQLYHLIFERMTKVHDLHNLIWVWNVYPASQDKGDPAEWYPGNQVVDIVATDYLQSKRDFDDLVALSDRKKLVAVAETMNPPDTDAILKEGAWWAYWVTWAKRDWNKNSEEDVKKAMQNRRTVNRQ